ncbi:MAG: dephospho-CoA kinase [Rudanella sp.]|nr:dephospho-CoA kinase [Rudanella sp.]
MKQIGITGGIGSGKSMVCQVFQTLDVPIYVADDRAKWLTDHDPILKADITRLLGPDAYTIQGKYNRPWVASQVFQNPDLLQQLNRLVHPRVMADTLSWVDQHRSSPYVIKEAALMRAAGDHNTLDKVVVVQAPTQLRVKRVRQRDPHRSDAEIQAIIANQMSDAERAEIADYVLINDEATLLLPQILALHNNFSTL